MASYSEKDIEHEPWSPKPSHCSDASSDSDIFNISGSTIQGHYSRIWRAYRVLNLRRLRVAWAPACLVVLLYIAYRERIYNCTPLDATNSSYRTYQDTIAETAELPKSVHNDTPFPRKIWQTSTGGPGSLDEADTAAVTTWTKLNPGWRHEFLTGTNADTLVASAFRHESHIVRVFGSLTDPILRADLVRYLVMFSDGGLYSDLDTVALKPIDHWIASEHRAANVVVGIEYDRRDDIRWLDWTRDLQISTWTMVAQPGHPLFLKTVRKALMAIETLARIKSTHLDKLKPTISEVLDTTGPALFTDTIFEFLSERLGSDFTWLNVTKLERPLLVSDILILPVTGFGSGQRHSGAGPSSHPDALVRHLFRGSWKRGHKTPPPKHRADANVHSKTGKIAISRAQI